MQAINCQVRVAAVSVRICLLPPSSTRTLAARCLSNGALDAQVVMSSSTVHASGIASKTEVAKGIPKLDAIFVLGGGLAADGTLPLQVKRRLDVAHSLYLGCQVHAPPIVCLGGGTPHKPSIMDKDGFIVHEATRCTEYLSDQKRVPLTNLLKEVSSMDTVGNAFFALTIHTIPAKWKSVAVVTSHFHMPRSKALFEHIWHKAHVTPGLFDHSSSDLYFAEASDEGIFESKVLQARKAKEQAALDQFLQDSLAIEDLKHLHRWLHQTHRCYAVSRQTERTTNMDQRLLASY